MKNLQIIEAKEWRILNYKLFLIIPDRILTRSTELAYNYKILHVNYYVPCHGSVEKHYNLPDLQPTVTQALLLILRTTLSWGTDWSGRPSLAWYLCESQGCDASGSDFMPSTSIQHQRQDLMTARSTGFRRQEEWRYNLRQQGQQDFIGRKCDGQQGQLEVTID